MGNFITNIKVNHIFHLENFCIPISENEKKHLIITGKNGYNQKNSKQMKD